MHAISLLLNSKTNQTPKSPCTRPSNWRLSLLHKPARKPSLRQNIQIHDTHVPTHDQKNVCALRPGDVPCWPPIKDQADDRKKGEPRVHRGKNAAAPAIANRSPALAQLVGRPSLLAYTPSLAVRYRRNSWPAIRRRRSSPEYVIGRSSPPFVAGIRCWLLAARRRPWSCR
jgi:hypothetical protein